MTFNRRIGLLITLLFVSVVSGMRVLIVGTNIGYSHQQYSGRAADVLVEAGHEVDYLIPLMNNILTFNGSRLARVRRQQLSNTERIQTEMFKISVWNDAFENDMTPSDWMKFDQLMGWYCESLLSDSSLISDLQAANYDVAMAEHFDACASALFRHLHIPSTHVLSAIPMDEFTSMVNGIPIDLMNKPILFNPRQFTPIESWYEKMRNTVEFLRWRFVYMPTSVGHVVNEETKHQQFVRLWVPIFQTPLNFLGSVDYVWLNTNEQLEQPRALSSKIKSIGGIAVKKSGGLTEEMERLLNNCTEGAVLVSFGSIVDTTHMNRKLRDQFLEAFSRFPGFQFVWKVTRIDESLQSALKKHPNVRAVEWMDQSGILEHTNTRAFITHGGLNSINEAATFGVPLITIPFFGDQHINSAAVVSRGLAVALDRRRISADSVASALTRVLRSSKFELTAKDVERKIASAPISPSELFVRHVEFAAQHGGLRELQLPAASQSLWRQLSLDVWLTLLSGLVLLSVISLWSLRVALNFVTIQTASRMKNKKE
ncbi:UDP-glucuronosyltransferase [Aphelenchoides besseyi]|nr:UDP-glucuronosyltransferase [Aphelenchoides besseyi]